MYKNKRNLDWLQASIGVLNSTTWFLCLIVVCYDSEMTLETKLITMVAMFVVMVGLWVVLRDD